jgi:hypothetical protein
MWPKYVARGTWMSQHQKQPYDSSLRKMYMLFDELLDDDPYLLERDACVARKSAAT